MISHSLQRRESKGVRTARKWRKSAYSPVAGRGTNPLCKAIHVLDEEPALPARQHRRTSIGCVVGLIRRIELRTLRTVARLNLDELSDELPPPPLRRCCTASFCASRPRPLERRTSSASGRFKAGLC